MKNRLKNKIVKKQMKKDVNRWKNEIVKKTDEKRCNQLETAKFR